MSTHEEQEQSATRWPSLLGVMVDHVEVTGNIHTIFLLGDINTVNAPWSCPIAIVLCAAWHKVLESESSCSSTDPSGFTKWWAEDSRVCVRSVRPLYLVNEGTLHIWSPKHLFSYSPTTQPVRNVLIVSASSAITHWYHEPGQIYLKFGNLIDWLDNMSSYILKNLFKIEHLIEWYNSRFVCKISSYLHWVPFLHSSLIWW
jgi:hypothetical protein